MVDETGSADASTSAPDVHPPRRRDLPHWFRALGEGAWLFVGLALSIAIVLLALGLVSDLVIPLIFAAILATIFVPLVDVLERWRIPRWLGAVLVMLIAIALLAFIVWLVVTGLVSRESAITREATEGLQAVPIADLTESALGVPLAGPIAIVTLVTSYIPFFGAFLSGAFAVVIAFGAQDLGVALAMLAIVLLSNNTLQNLLEPVAFGRALRLHPLTVMLVTTAGTLLFGVLGATLAAPVTAVVVRTFGLVADAGLLSARDMPSGHQVLGR